MKRWRRDGSRALGLAPLVALSLVYLVGPPTWMIRSSVSPDAELRRVPPFLLPAAPTVEHFQVILQLPGYDERALRENIHFKFYRKALLNSVVAATATTVVCTLLGAVFAYSLTRFVTARSRRWILLALLISRMLPVISILIPIYVMLLLTGLL